jgi:hypothetical protein
MNDSLKNNQLTSTHISKARFSYEHNAITGRLKLKFPESFHFRSYKSPADILGFKTQSQFTGELIGQYESDLSCGVHNIAVYTDIVEYSHIGDTKAPLLKVVPLNTRMRNNALYCQQAISNKEFDTLEFKDLIQHDFHSITVHLRDSTGNPINFSSVGRVHMTLLFRKVAD